METLTVYRLNVFVACPSRCPVKQLPLALMQAMLFTDCFEIADVATATVPSLHRLVSHVTDLLPGRPWLDAAKPQKPRPLQPCTPMRP